MPCRRDSDRVEGVIGERKRFGTGPDGQHVGDASDGSGPCGIRASGSAATTLPGTRSAKETGDSASTSAEVEDLDCVRRQHPVDRLTRRRRAVAVVGVGDGAERQRPRGTTGESVTARTIPAGDHQLRPSRTEALPGSFLQLSDRVRCCGVPVVVGGLRGACGR